MSHINEDLYEELMEAVKRRNLAEDAVGTARIAVSAAKAALRERTGILDRAANTVREIESEILTGASSVPLIAAAAARRNGEAQARGQAHAEPREPRSRKGPKGRGRAKTGDDDEEPDRVSRGDAEHAEKNGHGSGSPLAGIGDRWVQAMDGLDRPSTPAAAKASRELAAAIEAAAAVEFGDAAPPRTMQDAMWKAVKMAEVNNDLVSLKKTGATDAAILAVLSRWPTDRWLPGQQGVIAWGVVGGDVPAFFSGADAERGWPTVSLASLGGAGLVARVRRTLAIPAPKRRRRTARARMAGIPPDRPVEAPAVRRLLVPECVDRPEEEDGGYLGWDEGSLLDAGARLGLEQAPCSLDRIVICNRCEAARRGDVQRCPSCWSPEYRPSRAHLEQPVEREEAHHAR